MSYLTQSIRDCQHPKAYVSTIATNLLHQKSPWVTAWWSAVFPGFSQIIIGSYVEGFLLIGWELFVNINANINTAILYSFTGMKLSIFQWLVISIRYYRYATRYGFYMYPRFIALPDMILM